MDWADLLHADNGAIIYGLTDNPTLLIWLLSAGGPLQLYSLSFIL